MSMKMCVLFRPQCDSLRRNNYYTGNDQCKYGFDKYILYTSTQYENLYRTDCRKCGFLWLKKCCEDVYIGQGRRELNLYGCNRNVSQQLGSYGSASIQSTYVFGGSYTTQKVNPVTNAFTCPLGLSEAYNLDGIQVCLAERVTSNTKTLPSYGGIYSCQYGNIATRSRVRACSEGYSAYAMGTINGNCFLEVCLKFEKLDDVRGLPAVALPPFFSIDTVYLNVDTNETIGNDAIYPTVVTNETIGNDTIYPTVVTNETTENDTVVARMIRSVHLIDTFTSSASQSNDIEFGVVFTTLCIGIIHYISSLILVDM